MAKKKARKRGAPSKTCPSCGKSNHARRKVCEFCQYEFEMNADDTAGMKKRAANGRMRKASAAGAVSADTERLAMEFVLFSQDGDIGKALHAVEAYEETPLDRFVEQAGGKQRAVSALASLKSRIE